MEDQPSDPHNKSSKIFSCVRCFERKVKCDKSSPCSGCLRSNVECIFRTPAPPRRKKRKSTDENVHARLKRYEELLREKGVDPASSVSSPSKTAAASTPENGALTSPRPAKNKIPDWVPGEGKLIVDHGRSRFFENKLWTTVRQELHHEKDALPDSETEDDLETPLENGTDFMLGMTSSPAHTSSLHPSNDHILKLWQIYLSNFNPLIKIIHRPSTQQAIEEAMSDLDHIPRGLEALMFSIYSAAVFTMRSDDCFSIFGESRAALLSRYRLGVRRCLTKAHFMASSDLLVLEALTIYLLTMRQELDARSIWILTGVATRMSQGMGVHRDGTTLGLPPFETEMRRRLWWLINMFDFKAAEMSGIGGFGGINWWSTKAPSNVDDSFMWPTMTELPVERDRPGEMVVCMLQYEMGAFWRKKLLAEGTKEEDFAKVMQTWVMTKTIAEKDAFADEFQADMEEKVLRYCDPSVPLQMLALIIGRSICKSIRFMSHHPRRYASEKEIPEHERDFLWEMSMGVLEADNLAHSHRSLQKFQWHIEASFQWHAFIYVLGDLIERPTEAGKDEAWLQIEDIFKNHSNFITDRRKPLHLAIGNLCLRAWRVRENLQAEDARKVSTIRTPDFIVQLRRLGEAKAAKAEELKVAETLSNKLMQPTPDVNSQTDQRSFGTTSMSSTPYPETYGTATAQTFSPNDFSVMDDMPMDWQRWDTLLNDFDIPARVVQAPTMHPAHMHLLGHYGQQGYSWPLTAHKAQ